MSCDIRMLCQKKIVNNDVVFWDDVETPDILTGRFYLWFALIADVRNYADIVPISHPRGVPFGFVGYCAEPIWSAIGSAQGELVGDERDIYLGDHSHSWLTVAEILSRLADDTVLLKMTRVISLAAYNSWDGVSEPSSHSRPVFGGNVTTLDRRNHPKTTIEVDPSSNKEIYVHVSWVVDHVTEFAHQIAALKTLQAEHGEVRLVFGFDG